MLATIPGVLTAEELEQIRGALAEAPFEDGKLTARGGAESVKQNLQLKLGSDVAGRLGQQVVNALTRSEQFRGLVMPRAFAPPLFVKYGEGMAYGHHVDSPIMGVNPAIRTDVSISIALFRIAHSISAGSRAQIRRVSEEKMRRLL